MARIIVIGGSLGGLLVATMLQRAGHEVLVLEKATTSLDGRGAGIVTHIPLLAALKRCGLTVDASLGVSVHERIVLERDGSVLASAKMPQLLTSWSRLYVMLSSAFKRQNHIQGATVSNAIQNEKTASVNCEDGRIFDADLVIASDGIRSTIRKQFLTNSPAEYAGYVAWRGVCDEQVLSQKNHQQHV